MYYIRLVVTGGGIHGRIELRQEYANFGFDFMQEKLEENPNYFFKETAFLRVFLGFLNKDEEEDMDEVPESLD